MINNSLISKTTSLDVMNLKKVNITNIHNLNLTNDLFSVSEDSFVIDEEDEYSD